ncbi:exodeoxyribonuclease VII small subunit [Acanthopleuribacter pedis]|uniref:Exodeoxyribonuclease 7 small subunit n=1 Tax=Acanthopleuribacter pedis TaxID=442870 RepID=A0A8J7Q7Z7_9BACT|nr:exodeoxyribonuclease VII small subunit [Acanthopleuribacter pedis]MBO1320086.1 exodeoxyribonuclease VII small subunit [Acanthopleuribacter pedis]
MEQQTPDKQPGFEERLALLEQIVEKLDATDVPLEEAIGFYEDGIKLSASLHKTLEQAQERIELLTQAGQDIMETEPFEAQADA